MPSKKEWASVEDFAEYRIPRAERRGDTIYAIQPVSESVETDSLDEVPRNDQSFVNLGLLSSRVVLPNSEKIAIANTISGMLSGPRVSLTLFLPQNVREALRDIKLSSQGNQGRKLNNGKVLSLALAYSVTQRQEWVGEIPVDGRASEAEFVMSSVQGRTSIVTYQALINNLHLVHLEQESVSTVRRSLEGMKLTAILWGLNHYESWKELL